MRRPVRDEKDATGTHIGPHPTVGAQVLLVLTVADIVLKIVRRAHIMKVSIIKEGTTAKENAIMVIVIVVGLSAILFVVLLVVRNPNLVWMYESFLKYV